MSIPAKSREVLPLGAKAKVAFSLLMIVFWTISIIVLVTVSL